MIQIIIVFVTYIVVLLGIAYVFSKRSKSSSEFILGGRSTNYWVTAIALQASDMSHWLFLGVPGIIYAFGLFRVWEFIGLVIFMFLNWHFIAPKLRRATEKLHTITLFSYFEKRFNDTSGIIRITTAIISIIFFTFYISSGLVALGRVFQLAFGLEYHIGILISLVTILTYTLFGGFLGVAWCDFFQGMFAVSMMVLVPIVAYKTLGSFGPVIQAAQTKSLNLSLIPSLQSLWTIPVLLLGWGPGYFGQPQLLAFFMGIKDPKNIKYAKYIGLMWQITILTAAIFVGLLGLAYFQNISGEMVFVVLTKTLFSPLVAGFVLCAILAATLTTLDSQILASGSVLAEDIYKKLFKKHASSKEILWICRLGALLISFIALIISINNSTTIYDLVNYAWSGMGSAFGPLVIMSLYSKHINKYGAFAGILVGAITSAIWPYINITVLPLLPGFTLSFITIYVVSYLTVRNSIQTNS